MRLYFNGCSHTFGDDLDEPASQSWPAILAKQLNCKFENDSVSGGTNDRIIYRTLKNVHYFDKIYIAWTYTSRFTQYRSDNNHEVNFNPQLTHHLYGKTVEFQQYGKLHYAVWHNEIFSFKRWLQNIILMQRFLESIKKPYVMINASNNNIDRWTVGCKDFNNSVKSLLCFDVMDDEQLYLEHIEIQNLLNQINFINYVGWNSWWLTQMCHTYPTGSTNHLLEAGHRATAEYILKHDTH